MTTYEGPPFLPYFTPMGFRMYILDEKNNKWYRQMFLGDYE